MASFSKKALERMLENKPIHRMSDTGWGAKRDFFLKYASVRVHQNFRETVAFGNKTHYMEYRSQWKGERDVDIVLYVSEIITNGAFIAAALLSKKHSFKSPYVEVNFWSEGVSIGSPYGSQYEGPAQLLDSHVAFIGKVPQLRRELTDLMQQSE